MEENTTTEATVDDGGAIDGVAIDDQGRAVPEPEETEDATAVEQTTDTEQEQESTEEASAESVATDEPSDDDQLAKFAEAKGLTLDSDNAKKAAKMAMNAERLMHQKSAKASELEKAAKITDEQVPDDATPQQADNVRLRNLELSLTVQQWKNENPDKLALEYEMVKVLADPVKRELVQAGYLTLDEIHSLASNSQSNQADLKSQGKQEALKNLAQKQQAAVPRGNAVSASAKTSEITPQNVDQLVASHDQAWFEKNYESINKAMAF